jgi:hypothetical protein
MVSVYRTELKVNGLFEICSSPNTNIAPEGSANMIPVPTATFPPAIITRKAN